MAASVANSTAATLRAFAYNGGGGGSAGPSAPQFTVTPRVARRRRPGACFWTLLGDDELDLVCAHLDDRQLARLACTNRHTHRVSKAAMKRQLGLSDSQWQVFRAVLERRESVFITGNPGCGKSKLLSVLIERLPNCGVSASTGAAAEKIDGVTLHSLMGLPLNALRPRKPDDAISDIAWSAVRKIRLPTKQKLRTLDCIVIDEVSMLDCVTLDVVVEILNILRRDLYQMGTLTEPLQYILSGDPMQLQAVEQRERGAFYSSNLVENMTATYVLTESFRQQEGSVFAGILNRARRGRATPDDLAWLQANAAQELPANPLLMYCRTNEVDEMNEEKMEDIPHPTVAYASHDEGVLSCAARVESSAPRLLKLKKSARVMLTRNLHQDIGLHNGSLGVAEELNGETVKVRFDNGQTVDIHQVPYEVRDDTVNKHGDPAVIFSRTQFPLKVAFAVSVHKAQGATVDSLVVDLTNAFCPGQAYVALSRVREIEHAYVAGLTLGKLNHVDRAALSFYQRVRDASADRVELLEIEEEARFVPAPAAPTPAPTPAADAEAEWEARFDEYVANYDSEQEWDAIVANLDY